MPKSLTEVENMLKKCHLRLMRHKETAPYIGAMMLGESKVVDGKIHMHGQDADGNDVSDDVELATAATNGIDKFYAKKFIEDMSLPELCGLVLHENMHVFLKQIPRHLDLRKEDHCLLNAAMDFVVNDIIVQLQDKNLAVLPNKEKYGGCWDEKFRDWSVRQVYHFLKTGIDPKGNKTGKPVQSKGPGKLIIKIGNGEYSL